MRHDITAILDRIGAGVLITDRQGGILYANALFRKLSGCSPMAGMGKPRIQELRNVLERIARPAPRPASLKEFRDQERAHILAALDHAGGKIYGPDGAAAMLGLAPTTLVSRLRKYGVPAKRPRVRRTVAARAPQPIEEFEPPMLD